MVAPAAAPAPLATPAAAAPAAATHAPPAAALIATASDSTVEVVDAVASALQSAKTLSDSRPSAATHRAEYKRFSREVGALKEWPVEFAKEVDNDKRGVLAMWLETGQDLKKVILTVQKKVTKTKSSQGQFISKANCCQERPSRSS